MSCKSCRSDSFRSCFAGYAGCWASMPNRQFKICLCEKRWASMFNRQFEICLCEKRWASMPNRQFEICLCEKRWAGKPNRQFEIQLCIYVGWAYLPNKKELKNAYFVGFNADCNSVIIFCLALVSIAIFLTGS